MSYQVLYVLLGHVQRQVLPYALEAVVAVKHLRELWEVGGMEEGGTGEKVDMRGNGSEGWQAELGKAGIGMRGWSRAVGWCGGR